MSKTPRYEVVVMHHRSGWPNEEARVPRDELTTELLHYHGIYEEAATALAHLDQEEPKAFFHHWTDKSGRDRQSAAWLVRSMVLDNPHIDSRGRWQSDKYGDWAKPDYLPLSFNDKMAWPFLWLYAHARRGVDAEFFESTIWRLEKLGFRPPRWVEDQVHEMEHGKFEPDWAMPPGTTISTLLEKKDLTLEDLGIKLGWDSLQVDALMEGKTRIDGGIAWKLAELLGGSNKFWVMRDLNYLEAKRRLAADAT